jgi:hypothetical protein
MAAAKSNEGKSSVVVGLSILVISGLAALVWYFRDEAETAGRELERNKQEYRDMVRMKKPIEDYLKNRSRKAGADPGSKPGEDLVTFLSRKATQAQIPANLFSIAKNPDLTSGGWKESSFTVTLRATKDNPVARGPVVDFIRLVEQERPSLKVKNMNLVFAGDPLQSAALTFSSFEQAASSRP